MAAYVQLCEFERENSPYSSGFNFKDALIKFRVGILFLVTFRCMTRKRRSEIRLDVLLMRFFLLPLYSVT